MYIYLYSGEFFPYHASISISVADTWLHIATTTVTQPIYATATASSSYSLLTSVFPCQNFSGFDPNYGNYSWSPELICFHGNYAPNINFYYDITESPWNETTVSYLTPSQIAPDIDFAAYTIGVQTTCTGIRDLCHGLGTHLPGTNSYSCGPNIIIDWSSSPDDTIGEEVSNFTVQFGNLSVVPPASQTLPLVLRWFDDANLETPYVSTPTGSGVWRNALDRSHSLLEISFTEPGPDAEARLYAVLIGSYHVDVQDGSQIGITSGPQSFGKSNGSVSAAYIDFGYSCEMTLFNVNYTMFNGSYSISSATASVPLSRILANQMEYPNDLLKPFPEDLMCIECEISNTIWNNFTSQASPDDLQTSTESAIRITILRWMEENMLSSSPAIAEQQQRELLLARVPKAPIWTLVSLCFVYTGLGVAVTCWALFRYKPSTLAIRDRLSVKGIVYQLCNVLLDGSRGMNAKDASSEKADKCIQRVGVEKENGNWILVSNK